MHLLHPDDGAHQGALAAAAGAQQARHLPRRRREGETVQDHAVAAADDEVGDADGVGQGNLLNSELNS